jgi:hypothetical protein
VPAKDIYHDHVRKVLEADGWKITNDPMFLRAGGRKIYIDLAAEKVILAERETEKIAVEVKSFIGASPLNDLHEAVGQFLLYQEVLTEKDPKRILFIAMPKDAYIELADDFILRMLQKHEIHLLIFDNLKPEIWQWIK